MTLYWTRVNDTHLNDNVSYYEIMMADNSSFSNATIFNAGNNAAGQNIYETCSYTLSGLMDNTRYYFKIRAINDIGVSGWSTPQSIRIDLENIPHFDISYQQPANGAIGISKTPQFSWKGIDEDGDTLEYYVMYGESASAMNYNSGWIGSREFLEYQSVFSSVLKPNTTYYWQVMLREEGASLDTYNGEWIKSPVWSFTTSSEGPDRSS